MRIELVVTGPDIAANDLANIAKRARYAKPVMRSILGQLLVAEAKQFESSGGRSGAQWKPDKASTIARKKRAGEDLRPERATHELELSLVAWRDKNGIRRLNNQSLVLGTKLEYAKYQYRRPLLRFIDKDIENAETRIARWLMDGVA